MKVKVFGEGPHDVGRDGDNGGWVQTLIARLSSKALHIEAAPIRSLIALPSNRPTQWPPGLGKRAKLAMMNAGSTSDLVVFVTDADTSDRRVWRRKVEEIENGMSGNWRALGVPCVPMTSSEAWLLADEAAWGERRNRGKKFPKAPESIWGERHDPSSNHPKNYFAHMCQCFDYKDNRLTRQELADKLSLAELRARCSSSFKDFETKFSAAVTD